MAFQIKIGSLTLVTRLASEAVDRFDPYKEEAEVSIADMDGKPIDVDDLRDMVAEIRGTISSPHRFL